MNLLKILYLHVKNHWFDNSGLRRLQTDFISNENHVKKAQAAAEGAKSQANKANDDLYKLNSDFKTVSESLKNKEANIGSAKDRALSLQKRASALSNSASQKLADLLDMERQYEKNQKELETLSETLQEMNCQMQIYLKVIVNCILLTEGSHSRNSHLRVFLECVV